MKQKQRIFSLFLLVALVFSLASPVSAAGEMNFTDVAPAKTENYIKREK